MESLRKWLGVAVLGLFGAAALFGVINLLVNAGDTFDHGFEGDMVLVLGLPWILRLIGWVAIIAFAVLGVLKLLKAVEGLEDKVALLVLIEAILEFVVYFLALIVYIKNDAIKHVAGKHWALLFVTLLVIVALLVRMFALKENGLVGGIILAACALAMFVVFIIFLDGAKELALITWLFFMFAALGSVGVGVLGLLKK